METKETIIETHKKLHESLDKLVACYISETNKGLYDTSLMELIEWSYQQTINPSCYKEEK